MKNTITETLTFEGYTLEDNYTSIPENVCGVYCAYACAKNDKGNWEGSDIVYFGKSNGDVRGRVYDHTAKGDKARKTFIYCYAKTDHEIECEKALVAAHLDLPRLANDKLTVGYKGSEHAPYGTVRVSHAHYGCRREVLKLPQIQDAERW